MKKFLLTIIAFSLIYTGCKEDDSVQAIEKKIIKYKSKVEYYQNKIAELEQQLPIENVQKILVKVETVKPQVFDDYLDVSASIEPVEDAFINPQSNGTIKAIYVREGDYVQKGQLLMELDDALIRSNISQLEVQLLLADSLYRKQKVLYEQGVISEVQYLQAKNQKEALEKNLDVLKTQLSYTKVYAPFSGMVEQINVKVGELANPQLRAIYLVNMEKMKAVAYIAENYFPVIHKGDPVIIMFSVYKDLKIKTKISNIGNTIDPSTGTFKVVATFVNPGMKVKPNMSASMRFITFKTNNAIVVPTQLLKKDAKGWYVYVVKNEGDRLIAERRYITIGKVTASKALVLTGLKSGDQIITKGFHLVHHGSLVKIVN